MEVSTPTPAAQESTHTRRGVLRKVAQITTALALGATGKEVADRVGLISSPEQKRSPFVDMIRDLKQEDLDNPESAKFKAFIKTSAQEFSLHAEMNNTIPGWLISRSYFYTTTDQFLAGVNKHKGTSKKENWGAAIFEDKTTHTNLEAIKKNLDINYPGVILYESLVHEWAHILQTDRTEGQFLRSPKETLTSPDSSSQQWAKYRGGRILTETNGYALEFFDEAWVEYIAQTTLVRTLQNQPDLLLSAVQLLPTIIYSEQVRKFAKVAEKAGLNIRDLVKMHYTSDVEGVFTRLGSAFKNSALTEVRGDFRGERSDAEIKEQKDYLVGKTLAFIINAKNWDTYGKLLTHLK